MFSAELNCVEFYPRTSAITIAGDHTVRWAKSRHAAKQGNSLGKHAQKSPPNLCSEGYTTFTALLHDKFLRPTIARALYSNELPHAFNGSNPVVSVSITISRMADCHKKFTKKLRL